MKYIFLDFDGVLHSESMLKHPLFFHAKKFCDTIRPFKEKVKVVISSSWRCDYPLEQLVQPFDQDMQEIFIGVTPISDQSFATNGRYHEILQFCDNHKIDDDDWIALDDMQRLFPENLKNLVLIDSSTGIMDDDMKKLTQFLESKE